MLHVLYIEQWIFRENGNPNTDEIFMLHGCVVHLSLLFSQIRSMRVKAEVNETERGGERVQRAEEK